MDNTINMIPDKKGINDNETFSPRDKPDLKRSVSSGFTTRLNDNDIKLRKRSNSRYRPYRSTCRSIRSSKVHAHNPQSTCLKSPSTTPAKLNKRRLSLPDKHATATKRDQFCDVKDIKKLLEENDHPKDGRLSILDVALRLKDSLTIGRQDYVAMACKDIFRMNSTKRSRNPDENSDFQKDDKTQKSTNPIHKSSNINNVKEDMNKDMKKNLDENENDSFEDFFPSFGDEFYLPEMTRRHTEDGDNREEQSYSLKGEKTSTENIMWCKGAAGDFPDNETVIQELRKAKTVILLDDENETHREEFDFDFSLPPLAGLSCEGHKAKLAWDDDFSNEYRCHGRCGDVMCNGCHQYLEEMLGNHLHNMHQDVIKSSNADYKELSDMQGTYTCSMCSTNLEIDPFNTMDFLQTGGATLRSHDCDAILFCPWCCSNRVVFHADRLNTTSQDRQKTAADVP